WWSELNKATSFVVIFWIITPILYFTNVFNSAYFPVSGYTTFDNTGALYNASAIVDTNSLSDEQAYNYSPVFMSITLVLAYRVAFGSFTSVLVHTFLWFRRDIACHFKTTLKDECDVHAHESCKHSLPRSSVLKLSYRYGLQFSRSFSWVFLSQPISMLMAIANQQVGLQAIHEMITGCMLSGRPVANAIYNAIAQMGTT
ncbi:hypothetical protein AX14_000954, partial [Amanita brunnescens Koide BX004]